VWVPACTTGKEAYSLAALLAENIERCDKRLGLQIFATDADASAIEMARSGQYSEDDLKGISQERLARFFSRKNGRYEVVKQLRELIVFAPQDLLRDPPFSKLDFISCRNLFIYLDQSAQKKIIHLFHFALRESGYLFLGSAETVNGEGDLFETVSQKWRIYRKLGVATPVGLHLPLRPAGGPPVVIPAPGLQSRPTLPGITHQVIAEWFGPPAAVVDREGTLLYLHGHVEDFLQMAAGQQTRLLVDVAREGLRNRLAAALIEAANDNVKVTVSARVKKDQAARRSVPVKITVSPIRHSREVEGLLLVTFEEQKLPKSARASAAREAPRSDMRQLEDELKITREELSSTIAPLEQSNEHFKASCEEVTCANKELQSTNEELETSKEGLQSLNEELNAVNQRLHDKVVELEQASNDVANLLTSGDVATIFLDRELKVRRFTQAITKLLAVVETDAGRPLAHIHRKFQDEALLGDARRVLADLTPATAEVQAESGEWYLRRILPYRTRDDRIEGVAITFGDVTVLKQAETKLAHLASFPEQNPNPIVEVDFDAGVRYVNAAAQRLFPDIRERGAGHPYLVDWATTVRPLRERRSDATIRDVAVGERTYEQQCYFVARDRIVRIYGRDITEHRQAEEALQRANASLDRQVQDRTAELARRAVQLRALAAELTLSEQRERRRMAKVLHDHLQQLLVAAKFHMALLARDVDESRKAAMTEIDELLSESLRTSRSLTAELSPQVLHEGGLQDGLRWLARWMAEKYHLAVDLIMGEDIPQLMEDVKILLFESVRELLFNAVKHAGVDSVRVQVRVAGNQLRVAVSDEGAGFAAGQLRLAGTPDGKFGLFSIYERLSLLGGGMDIDSAPGRGSRFALAVPLGQATCEASSVRTGPVSKPQRVPTIPPVVGARIRVLVADDHSVMRDGLERLVNSEPDMETVGQAADGNAAIELARSLEPDVVLMDLNMPNLPGLEATRIITSEMPSVKVVGLSMLEESEWAQRMLAAGAVAYLPKSGPSGNLLAAIRACMK
jgi:two-component system, chemotaxis family, CheB/CheR fusion protein